MNIILSGESIGKENVGVFFPTKIRGVGGQILFICTIMMWLFIWWFHPSLPFFGPQLSSG